MEINSNITQHTVSGSLDASQYQPHADANVVKVKIQYPEDYKGKKFFADGVVQEVSKETAGIFLEKGIATLVTGPILAATDSSETTPELTAAAAATSASDEKADGDVQEVSKETAEGGKGKKAGK